MRRCDSRIGACTPRSTAREPPLTTRWSERCSPSPRSATPSWPSTPSAWGVLVDRIAQRIGAGLAERRSFRIAALLHDIGMLAVPEPILSNAGPLSQEEWSLIHQHPLAGARVLAAAPDLHAAAQIVRASHERWDGSGYPDGLSGRDIPLGARLLLVCDAYEAMLRVRPHAPPRSPADALTELHRCAGTQFDPDSVAVFAALLAEDVAGHGARSGLGETAVQ